MWYVTVAIIVGVLAVLFLACWLLMIKVTRNSNPKFWNFAVKRMEKKYKGDYPQGRIVFYGSSSIHFWKTLDADMAPLQVLRHGISGTKVADATYFLDRLVVPFHPKAVVLFAGTNDISELNAATRTGEQVYKDTLSFFERASSSMPGVPVYYIAITPTPTRKGVRGEVDAANLLIREYIERDGGGRLHFIDTYNKVLNKAGEPKQELFRSDGIHFNEAGYKVWTDIIKPMLLKDLGG